MTSIWVPATALARELGVNRRTIGRWAVGSDFPSALVFNKRLYFRRDEIDAWKESCGSAMVRKSGVWKPPAVSETLQDIPEDDLTCSEYV